MTDASPGDSSPDTPSSDMPSSAAPRGAAASRALLPPGADDATALPLLADPDGYRACEHDLLADDAGRAYWLELFATHIQVQLEHARSAGLLDAAGADEAAAEMRAAMDLVARTPDRHGRLDILVLDSIRRRVLADAGIVDEFRDLKARENARAMATLPAQCARLDRMVPVERAAAILESLLAGNLFDMGAKATAARFGDAPPAFDEIVRGLPPRPWHRDDVSAAVELIVDPPAASVILVDNAGADAVLGALPLARELVRGGGRVIMGANAQPALNDVTASELRAVLREASAIDPVFDGDAIEVVETGSSAPLIDLAAVSRDFAAAAGHPDVGLLVLLGMGRGIESNWTARFTVPSLRVAMIKDPQVAARLDATMPDAIVRVESATGRRS